MENVTLLNNLEEVDLSSTIVTADGVAGLKQAMPNCHIWSDFKRKSEREFELFD